MNNSIVNLVGAIALTTIISSCGWNSSISEKAAASENLTPEEEVIYVAELSTGAIRKISIESAEVTTLATGLFNPAQVAKGTDGNILVAEPGNQTITLINAEG